MHSKTMSAGSIAMLAALAPTALAFTPVPSKFITVTRPAAQETPTTTFDPAGAFAHVTSVTQPAAQETQTIIIDPLSAFVQVHSVTQPAAQTTPTTVVDPIGAFAQPSTSGTPFKPVIPFYQQAPPTLSSEQAKAKALGFLKAVHSAAQGNTQPNTNLLTDGLEELTDFVIPGLGNVIKAATGGFSGSVGRRDASASEVTPAQVQAATEAFEKELTNVVNTIPGLRGFLNGLTAHANA